MRRTSSDIEDIYVVGRQLPRWRLRLIQLGQWLKTNRYGVTTTGIGLAGVIAIVIVTANPPITYG